MAFGLQFNSIQYFFIAILNPFPANIANKRHLGSAPKTHFCDLTGKTEVIGLSDLMTLSLTWGVYIANRCKKQSMF
jgi:hypothetical protein